jgi:hypothetical protein
MGRPWLARRRHQLLLAVLRQAAPTQLPAPPAAPALCEGKRRPQAQQEEARAEAQELLLLLGALRHRWGAGAAGVPAAVGGSLEGTARYCKARCAWRLSVPARAACCQHTHARCRPAASTCCSSSSLRCTALYHLRPAVHD